MKKLAVALLLAVSTTAFAGGPHYHNRHHRSMHQHHWVAPMVIGGVVTYVLTRPQPVYQTQPYPYPAPQPACTRYIYQDQYGNVQREEVRCN